MGEVITEFKESVSIELTNQEILDILKCLTIPYIQTHWDKQEASRILLLAQFFQELTKGDL